MSEEDRKGRGDAWRWEQPRRGHGRIGSGERPGRRDDELDPPSVHRTPESGREGRPDGSTVGFRGRGPRGYRRSSERIYEDVCEALTDHPGIDAGGIEVEVDDGIVTLLGTVDDRRQKRLAEDLAERARGVRDVRNRLELEDGMLRDLSERAGRSRGERAVPSDGGETGLGDFRDPDWRAADLRGFDVEGHDGEKLGTVDDRSEPGSDHIVVDTGPWIFGRTVILPAGLIEAIDFAGRTIFVESTRGVVKNAPEFDEERYDDPDYRNELRGYYEHQTSRREPSRRE